MMNATRRTGRTTGMLFRFRVHCKNARGNIAHETHNIVALDTADAWNEMGKCIADASARTKVVCVRLLAK